MKFLLLSVMRKHLPIPKDAATNCMNEGVFYNTFDNPCLSKVINSNCFFLLKMISKLSNFSTRFLFFVAQYVKNFDNKAFAADVQAQLLQPVSSILLFWNNKMHFQCFFVSLSHVNCRSSTVAINWKSRLTLRACTRSWLPRIWFLHRFD